jgi:hypothetical protein
MKKKLVDHNCTNVEQQRDVIKRVQLESMDECDFLQGMIFSIPIRMQEIIDREGGMTRY